MARIEALKAKLAAREGKAEYKENCDHLRAEIAVLEARAAKVSELRDFASDEGGGL